MVVPAVVTYAEIWQNPTPDRPGLLQVDREWVWRMLEPAGLTPPMKALEPAQVVVPVRYEPRPFRRTRGESRSASVIMASGASWSGLYRTAMGGSETPRRTPPDVAAEQAAFGWDLPPEA